MNRIEFSRNRLLAKSFTCIEPVALVAIVFLMLAFCSTVQAQSTDEIEQYLSAIDKNKDGILEVSDMSGRSHRWIGKMGFDTSKRLSIKKIVSKLNRDHRKKEQLAAKQLEDSRPRKVPGFGVAKSDSNGVSGFSNSETESKRTYSESVLKQVASTLERYDRNKNGSLEKNEIERAQWGSPPVEQSDVDRNGKLSRLELSNRYYDREQYARALAEKQQSAKAGRPNNPNTFINRRGGSDGNRRSRFEASSVRASNGLSSKSKSKSSPSKTVSSTSSGSSSSATRTKLRGYVSGVFDSYDKDKDGRLNKDEIKGMRRPPTGADADGDGFVTQSELVDKLSGNSKPSGAKTSASSAPKESDSGSRRSRSKRNSPRSLSRNSGSSSSFEKLDANEDHQIQMHEFSSSWDGDTVKKFEEKDLNGDGVITHKEWSNQNE